MNVRLLCLLFLLAIVPGWAAPVRITTWDLKPKNSSNEGGQNIIQQAADSLKKLHPDVILLQDVHDWQTCHQIAQALVPEVYQVIICSSFRDRVSETAKGQAAILSKSKAYIAWSEPAEGEGVGGFAFAALRLGDKTVGFFSVSPARELGPQIVKQISALQSWKDNRPDGFIVAGTLRANDSTLEQIGFENASTGDSQISFLTRDVGSVPPPVFVRARGFEYPVATCDVDLDGPKLARTPLSAPQPIASAPIGPPSNQSYLWIAGVIAGLLALFAVTRKLSRRSGASKASSETSIVAIRPQGPPYVRIETEGSSQTHSQSARLPSVAGPVTQRIPAEVHAGVVAHLSHWLKQKLVRQLVADRAQLLATQHAATLKMIEVDERLARVERQIQQSQQDYERRIDDLTKELLAAREENRELIRAKIALVKMEMDDARLKAAQRNPQRQPQ